MSESAPVAIVAPAYNEEDALPALLAAVPPAMEAAGLAYQVVIVDDGSVDRTAEVAEGFADRMPLQVVRHATNQNLGRALRTGLQAALALEGAAQVIVTLDADNTHPPALIPDLVAAVAEGLDVVIASRYAAGGREVGLAWHRKILSRGASTLLRFCRPVRGARDYTCGFRAYRREILERGFAAYGDDLIAEVGFTCMAELLLKLGFLGARVGERPLVLRYDLKRGKSKMNIGRTIRGYFRLIRELRPPPSGG